ncbi:MAG: feruloyl-CoA synthase [Gammaproteobacteria bacterium]|nr:feruloyl-CoA synthase [Gammaproteobacteria bacterium]
MNGEVARGPSEGHAAKFADPHVLIEARADGTRILRSGMALGDSYARCVGEWLEHWARTTPGQIFLAERDTDDRWQTLSYGETHERVLAVAGWLCGQNLSAERPVVILSDNSIEHAILSLAAMHIGIPSSSISPGNSLMSRDFGKLKANFELLTPGVVFADPIEKYKPALDAVRSLYSGVVVSGKLSGPADDVLPFSEIEAQGKGKEELVMSAFRRITPETIGKFLFTSGSVGSPKAVVNTQRMMCSNQRAKELMWPLLSHCPPVLVEWLPWSHTFGGNHNFNMVLRWGGTLYIDSGKPAPGLIEPTIRNLREISPTMYFNVPRAYDMLVPLLEADADLRENFFRKLEFVFYAGAALPRHLWEKLERMGEETTGRKVLVVSSWGATETAPIATDCHFQAVRPGVIGLPVPGTELKLVPVADKMEVRVRGPNVFPCYWKQPDVTAKAFDEEGFYMCGDAVEFVDVANPTLGLLFDGRVGEDFKLLTGTWVHVGTLRVAGIDALKPLAQDIVVTGHDRDDVGFLVFPNIPQCRALCGDLPEDASVEAVLAHAAVREAVAQGLAAMKARGGGSSKYASRAILLTEPPSVEDGEITDKGYINQRKVLTRRAGLVEKLYQESPDACVISAAMQL